MCNNLYSNIVILCRDILGVLTCSCAYVTCAAARDVCKFVTDTTVTPIEVTAHSIHFPLLCFIHAFICFCLYSAGSIKRRRGGEKMSYSVFTAQSDSAYFTHIFYRYCECRRVDRYLRNLWVSIHKHQIPCYICYKLLYR
jgi:hypothetical protein